MKTGEIYKADKRAVLTILIVEAHSSAVKYRHINSTRAFPADTDTLISNGFYYYGNIESHPELFL